MEGKFKESLGTFGTDGSPNKPEGLSGVTIPIYMQLSCQDLGNVRGTL